MCPHPLHTRPTHAIFPSLTQMPTRGSLPHLQCEAGHSHVHFPRDPHLTPTTHHPTHPMPLLPTGAWERGGPTSPTRGRALPCTSPQRSSPTATSPSPLTYSHLAPYCARCGAVRHPGAPHTPAHSPAAQGARGQALNPPQYSRWMRCCTITHCLLGHPLH